MKLNMTLMGSLVSLIAVCMLAGCGKYKAPPPEHTGQPPQPLPQTVSTMTVATGTSLAGPSTIPRAVGAKAAGSAASLGSDSLTAEEMSVRIADVVREEKAHMESVAALERELKDPAMAASTNAAARSRDLAELRVKTRDLIRQRVVLQQALDARRSSAGSR